MNEDPEQEEKDERLASLEHELRRSRETTQKQATLLWNASKMIERLQGRIEKHETQVDRIETALNKLYNSGRWRTANLLRAKNAGYREVDKLVEAAKNWNGIANADSLLEKTSRFISYEAWLDRQRPPANESTPAPPHSIHVVFVGGNDPESAASIARQTTPPLATSILEKDSADARNARWRGSSADFLLFLPSGDTLEPHALQLLGEAARNADVVYADNDLHIESGGFTAPFLKPSWSPEFALDCFFTGPGLLWRREFLEQLDGFASDDFPDYDLLLRADEAKARIKHVPAVLLHWQVVEKNPFAARLTPEGGEQVVADAMARREIKAKTKREETPIARFSVEREIDEDRKISVIIPTRNQLPYLKKAVDSITRLTDYPNYEIVIVDNQSDDPETIEWLDHCPHRVLRYDHPFNYSAINNFAVEETDGELILFLNNDTEVIQSEWLRRMAGEIRNPEIGAVGAQLLYANDTIQHAGVILGVGGLAGHAFRFQHAASPDAWGQIHYTRNVSAVTAACLLTRRDVFNEVGGFDADHLRVDYNDVDLCLKIREAGYRLVYTPHAKLYHHESVSAV